MLSVLLLGIAAAALFGAIAPAHGSPRAMFTVAISYSPSVNDPFLLTFSATVVPGAPTAYDWGFGDHQWLNGSGPAYASPVHRYSAPGTYNVTLLVFEGTSSVSQFLPLTVAAGALHVGITASSLSGSSPFTTTFTATISGGTGTYPSELWSFGDGGSGSGLDISYTYSRPGTYVVHLNVTDSAGMWAITQVGVNVSSAGGSSSPFTGTTILLIVAAGAIGGVALGALVVGLYLGRRPLREAPAEPAAPPAPASAPPGPSEPPAPVPQALWVIPAESPPPAEGEPETLPTGYVPDMPAPPSDAVLEPPRPIAAPEPKEPAAPSEPAAPGAVTPEALKLSQRIVLHLAGLGTLGVDEVAALGFTQLGMSQTLGTRQNALTNVLRRLLAAGVLSEDVRHVRGQPRRLKVYRLTGRGESLARDLRRNVVRPPPSSEPVDRST